MAFRAVADVIRGRRSRGQLAWAQKALCALRSQGKLPPDIEGSKMIRLVRELLARDPDYTAAHFGTLDRHTIEEAARVQGITWHAKRGRPKMGN